MTLLLHWGGVACFLTVVVCFLTGLLQICSRHGYGDGESFYANPPTPSARQSVEGGGGRKFSRRRDDVKICFGHCGRIFCPICLKFGGNMYMA